MRAGPVDYLLLAFACALAACTIAINGGAPQPSPVPVGGRITSGGQVEAPAPQQAKQSQPNEPIPVVFADGKGGIIVPPGIDDAGKAYLIEQIRASMKQQPPAQRDAGAPPKGKGKP